MKKEIYYISKFDSLNPDIGYNVSSGGRVEYKIPDSVKKFYKAKSVNKVQRSK